MHLPPVLLALACLSPPGLSWPRPSNAGLQEIEGVRDGPHGIERSAMKIHKRSDPDQSTINDYKDALKRTYLVLGRALPSQCVLNCVTKRSIELAMADQVPANGDGFNAALNGWEVGCKQFSCGEKTDGENTDGPTPADRMTPTVKQTRVPAEGVGRTRRPFRPWSAMRHPLRTARAARHRLGAWVGGW
ncbi:MAG: hypothetical protein M1826_004660 [Phylliscum demangeonii]|nr:MAG: hypothetical protein M1826_004660 [Phylliscum demangeonii]